MKSLLPAFLLLVPLLLPALHADDPPRRASRLGEWQFRADEPLGSADRQPAPDAARKLGDDGWESVAVPHVFRQSGLPDNTAGWYRTTVAATPREHHYLLHLEGAGSVTDVYVNGEHVGRHRGAFTSSVHDLTPALDEGADNVVALRVSNGDREAMNCLSHSTLYVTNGGLYRTAWLIETGKVHFEPHMGSSGLYLTGRDITRDSATLAIEAHVRNAGAAAARVTVTHVVEGPDGSAVGKATATAALEPGATRPLESTVTIADPELWDIRQPKLYRVTSTVSVDGTAMDTIRERTGLRTIRIDDGRFMLNGRELLVRGVNKHQQTEHEWNAITDEQLTWEWDHLDQLGANTVRLAHYPHRRFEYRTADERGIAIWAENGLAGQLWQHEVKRDSGEREPNADGERITREMVHQNWNHPSILFWSSGNETYEKVAAHYAEIIREHDASRPITYASAHEDRPDTVDFIAGNTYQGWYGGHFSEFSQLPRNKYVSETGAGTWVTHHIPQDEARWKVDDFEPMEYGNLFTEYRLQSVFRDNPEGHKMYLWWNFREFYDRKFKNNRNTKGMLTLAGEPKDVYYLHRAFLRPDLPVLHITSRNHFYRWFAPDNGTKVFSNADSVELFINGESQGRRSNGDYRQPISVYPDSWRNEEGKREGRRIDNVFFWKAPLQPGRNVIEAHDSNGQRERTVIYQWAETDPENEVIGDLESSNPECKAHFIDRPVEAQGAFYYMVDGSSDNTFDKLPEAIEGASWIATKRLSDPARKTDLSFTLKKDATVHVMHSTGSFPPIVLREPKREWVEAAGELGRQLEALGFGQSAEPAVWRGHDLWLADAAVWSRPSKAGDRIEIPGVTLDYVVMIDHSAAE